MSIQVNLAVAMAKKNISLNELAEHVGISATNLSLLKTGKVKGIRFATLSSICEKLECNVEDILEYIADDAQR